MRCKSADFIGAGREKAAATRPDIELQPSLSETHKKHLGKREAAALGQ
jgi:hypothetical protein